MKMGPRGPFLLVKIQQDSPRSSLTTHVVGGKRGLFCPHGGCSSTWSEHMPVEHEAGGSTPPTHTKFVIIKNTNQASKFYKLLISSPDTI